MIALKVKFDPKFPEINFQEELKVVARDIIIPIMQQNIENQVSLNEGILKPNDPKYTAWKAKKGLDQRILIAKGDLRSSFIYKAKGKRSVIVTLKAKRLLIGRYLEEMGKSFFGVSTRMKQSAMNYMKKRIKDIIDGRRK